MSDSLFKLSDDLRTADQEMEEHVDEETGLVPADLVLLWEACAGERDGKLKEWGKWAKNLRSDEEQCRAAARKLTLRAQAAARKLEWVASIIEGELGEGADLEDDFIGRVLKDGEVRLSWRKRTGVETYDDVPPAGAPERFVKQTPSWKRTEWGEYLKTATDEQRADAAKYARLKTGKGLVIA